MKKILIVDDMIVSLMMTENMLCGHYITFCASSGSEAIEIYRRERPDMVLSDLRMPGMNGYELQQILQKEMQKTIPFMFMTADSNEDTETQGFENGAMDFIRKPFRPDVLLRRVGNILQTVDQIEGLKRHASTDSLTGLLNKSSAAEKLKVLCAQARGASVGCVFVPQSGVDFSSLAKKADKALYAAKQSGKHGYAVFDEARTQAEDGEATTLSNVEKILDERSPVKGALQVPFEEFRAVYRFLRRTMNVFGKPASMLRFSLPKGTAAETEEEFFAFLCSTLREGDVVTRHGGQFLALLVNTDYPRLSSVVDRVRQNWASAKEEAGVEIEAEWTVMGE